MMRVIIIIALVAVVGALVYYRSQKAVPFLLGLLLGSATSIIRVLLLERLVNDVVSGEKSARSVQLGHFVRLMLAFAALLVGALVEQISLLGVIVGIFSYQLGTYSLHSTLKSARQRQPDKSGPDNEEENR